MSGVFVVLLTAGEQVERVLRLTPPTILVAWVDIDAAVPGASSPSSDVLDPGVVEASAELRLSGVLIVLLIAEGLSPACLRVALAL